MKAEEEERKGENNLHGDRFCKMIEGMSVFVGEGNKLWELDSRGAALPKTTQQEEQTQTNRGIKNQNENTM
jgi:hypothetical protein